MNCFSLGANKMKFLALLLIAFFTVSCGQLQTKDYSSSWSRSFASGGVILRKFLQAAADSGDNLAYKSVKEMEQKLLSEVKVNPRRFGIPDDFDVAKLKTLDDLPGERYLAEIIQQAPGILKFKSVSRTAAYNAVKREAGIAAKLEFSTTRVANVRLSPADEVGLGRTISKKIKSLESDLVADGVSSTQAKKIVENIQQSARDLASKAKADPSLKKTATQIIEYSTIISRKTGKNFLGKTGCFKIAGGDVLSNKAEIAYRVMKEMEQEGFENFNDYAKIGKTLQKHHGDVTNRTAKEACLAVRSLASVGPAQCDVYARQIGENLRCD